jgi:hypothetical protein
MGNDWNKQRKIATLPGVRIDAVTSLSRTLDKAQQGRVKSVCISIEWDDGTFATDYSNMKMSTLCMHVASLTIDMQEEFKHGDAMSETPQDSPKGAA